MERRKEVKTEFFVRCRRTYILNKLCTGLEEASTKAHWEAEHKRRPLRRLQMAMGCLPFSKHNNTNNITLFFFTFFTFFVVSKVVFLVHQ